MSDPQRYWDDVYGSKAVKDLSWYQLHPGRSLRVIRTLAPDHSKRIIDIGCGASALLGELAADGYGDLTGLDASAVAIQKTRSAMGDAADRVTWIVADITRWVPTRRWDLWHDRAVFHFLTGPEAQSAYIRAMDSALEVGSIAIIATFALDGPERCSGLPVQRYSAQTLAARLGPGYRLIEDASERHLTPRGTAQSFIYAVFERR